MDLTLFVEALLNGLSESSILILAAVGLAITFGVMRVINMAHGEMLMLGAFAGYVFTDPPLSLPAGHFGLGHGTGAHAPDEYYLIESDNPRVPGLDGAVASFVEYLYALA